MFEHVAFLKEWTESLNFSIIWCNSSRWFFFPQEVFWNGRRY